MKKVLDIDGSVVRGAVKTNSGSISFNDKAALSVYQKRKEIAVDQKKEIDDLKQQIALLMSLTKALEKDKNG